MLSSSIAAAAGPSSVAASAASSILQAAVSSAAGLQTKRAVSDERFADADEDDEADSSRRRYAGAPGLGAGAGSSAEDGAGSRERRVDAFGREVRPGAGGDARRDEAMVRDREIARQRGRADSDDDGGGRRHPAPPPPPPLPPAADPVAAPLELPEGVDEDDAMAAIMGFSSFETTHGKKVADNHSSAARGGATKVLKREYRQYMNRKGGFNRPLEASKPLTR